jgi:4'-phosphopantetheinyl transferase
MKSARPPAGFDVEGLTWVPAPLGRPLLAPEEVHVWRAPLDLAAPVTDSLTTTLSPDELNRAARFRDARHRRRFIASRGIQRDILARYVDAAPGTLCFRYGPYGKPKLADPPADLGLQFNASNSEGVALYAVSRSRQVGVDVELIRPSVEIDAVVESFCTPYERNVLLQVPPVRRLRAFFEWWTRKEAIAKGIGEGLSFPLDSFDVEFAPGAPARLLRIGGTRYPAYEWTLLALDLEEQFVGALAVEGQVLLVNGFEWAVPEERF